MPRRRPIADVLRATAAALDFEVRGFLLKAVVAAVATVFVVCLLLGLKIIATGSDGYRFGDFYALWSSAALAHDGAAASNYNANALHLRQVALGMHPDGYNPFPYPPTFLLILAPLGGLGLGAAYWLFMSATLAVYLWAATGPLRDWPFTMGALIAPATSVALMSGQSGLLSGGLMLGGLRLAHSRPIVAGVLFGLLAYKPQIGVLVPVALVAAGLWRAIFTAAVTAILCVALSSAVFGTDIWPAWLASLTTYSGRYEPVAFLMPTIAANARMLGASMPLSLAIQALAAVPVAVVVWRASRLGLTPQAGALLVVGTFLATPHAFNYDMPMTSVAALWYLSERLRATRSLTLVEIVLLAAFLVLPVAMLTMGRSAAPISWAPLLLVFCLIAKSSTARLGSTLAPMVPLAAPAPPAFG